MLKKILITIVILAGVTVYAWLEYTWVDKVVSNNSDGWTLVIKQKEDWTLIKPWTWFNRPIGTVLFVETGAFGKLNDQYYYAHTMTLTRGEDDYGIMDIIDIQNKKYATCNTLEEFQSLNPEKLKKLEWYNYKDSSNIFYLYEFLKKNVKTYFAIDPFGNEIDVTNYITCGQYTFKDGQEDHVFSLINKKPYKILNEDLALIEKSLSNWLKKKPEYEFKKEKINFNKIHYLHSQQMIATMTDVFTFDLNVKKNKVDTVLNFEFTFSKLYYPEVKSENSAIIFDNSGDL